MATGDERCIYEEDDRVDEYLLNQLGKYIPYHRLRALTKDLHFSQAEFNRIVIPQSQPEEQIFRVSEGYFHYYIKTWQQGV